MGETAGARPLLEDLDGGPLGDWVMLGSLVVFEARFEGEAAASQPRALVIGSAQHSAM